MMMANSDGSHVGFWCNSCSLHPSCHCVFLTGIHFWTEPLHSKIKNHPDCKPICLLSSLPLTKPQTNIWAALATLSLAKFFRELKGREVVRPLLFDAKVTRIYGWHWLLCIGKEVSLLQVYKCSVCPDTWRRTFNWPSLFNCTKV